MSSSSSSSNEEEDAEEMKKIRESIDPSFNFQNIPSCSNSNKIELKETIKAEKNTGNDTVNNWETVSGGGSGNGIHLQNKLTKENKKFISKKLAEYMEKSIKVVDKTKKVNEKINSEFDPDSEGIYLFGSSKSKISKAGLEEEINKELIEENNRRKKKRPKIKKRQIEDDCEKIDEKSKLNSVVIPSNYFNT